MIRVGILGAGIGAQHLAGYRQAPDRFDVTAICDLDIDRARGLAAGSAGVRATTDLESLLSDPAIDLVDICLPPHLHAPVGVRALAAGKHVVIEKPIARSLTEVDALADAAKAAKRLVFPVFQYRYGPAIDALRALIAQGLAGRPLVASLETHWNRGAQYYADGPWRGTWAREAGGAVLSHAIHSHDLLCLMFGAVAGVSSRLATLVNPIETEDSAAVAFEFANGALASSSVTLGAAADTTRLRFVFESLTAESGTAPYTPAEDAWSFIARDPEKQPAIDAIVAGIAPSPAGFAGFVSAVADALAGRPGRATTLEDGRRSIELVTAIYAADRTGRVARAPIERAHDLYDGWAPTEALASK